MSDLEGLRQTLRATQSRICKMETASRVRAARKLIDKTFRFRNCYSCPEKPSDYWFLYMRIIGVDRSGCLRVMQFQTDENGNIRIEPTSLIHHVSDGYEEISRDTFDRAWVALKKRVTEGINQ